jgi:hypothetical protein
MTLTPIATYLVNSPSSSTAGLTSPSFTPATGEIIVIKGGSEGQATAYGSPTATGGGITWTKRVENLVSNTCYTVIWTGVVTSGGSSITVGFGAISGTAGWHSMLVERWPTTAALAGTPATNLTNGSGAPSGSVTTAANGSAVSWVNGDWNAVSPTSRAYRGSPTEEGIHDKSGTGSYVMEYAYQAAATAGAQTYGLTAPTGEKYSLLAIEIQDTSGGSLTNARQGSNTPSAFKQGANNVDAMYVGTNKIWG